MAKYLRLNLDELFSSEFIYTSCDIGGYGHSVVIRKEDKDEFLEEMAETWKERVALMLEEDEDFDE
jgi:hypothetical protein